MESTTALSYLNATAPYLVVSILSIVIAVAEIVTVFENDAVRALRTSGSFLLIFLNAVFAILILAIVFSFGAGGGANRLWIALGVGLGFSTVLRTKFTFIKPFPGSSEEGVALSLDELYGRLQRFANAKSIRAWRPIVFKPWMRQWRG